MNVYIDDFLLVSNMIKNLDKLKATLSNTYDTKNLSNIKTIIRWQITGDFIAQTIKIDQSVFI